MAEPTFEDRGTGARFPETIDDDFPERALTPDSDDVAVPGEDGYVGSDAVGTTAEEGLQGETLEEKLSREVPDESVDAFGAGEDRTVVDAVGGPGGGDPVGQLVAPDGDAQFDTEKDEVAREEGYGGDSAEENAMHLEPERG